MGVIAKTETNPFFKSKYADLGTILSAIKDPLQKVGLTFSQFPSGENELTSIIMHPESGEWMEATYKMTPSKNDPQGQGSAITYQRRYALGAILALNLGDDDDGNMASTPSQTPISRPGAVSSQPEPSHNTPTHGFSNPSKPASDKQKTYIHNLLSQKGEIVPDPEWFNSLTMTMAKAEIDRLQKLEESISY